MQFNFLKVIKAKLIIDNHRAHRAQYMLTKLVAKPVSRYTSSASKEFAQIPLTIAIFKSYQSVQIFVEINVPKQTTLHIK